MTALEGQKGGKSSVEYKALSSEYSSLSQQIKSLESEIRSLDKEIDGNKVEMAGLTTQINSSNEAYEKMKTQLNNLKNIQITPKGLVELRTEIAKLTGMNIDEIPQDLEELQKVISGLTDKELDEISKSLVEIKNNSENLPESLNGAKEGMRGLGESGREVARAADDVENLKNQVLQFFSITNSVQLFKRAITSALNTVKELDATMTEAAVVTEFDVGDMWEKLPEYSKNAQALGVSINGMYQATTLYYQQGLKSNEAMELGIETMKMAKIAGMESAEATEAMTAALRGFNMQLNEASATKVNDVYSQLAAVTAADTEQIATAMEKTASIAASANMEFETTAALLAQIIETTQEAPETAGTAMKTIIARFAEVKSLREQGLTSGEDDEGEIIDVNKIQTALRSVGISMEGFFSGTEGLDSVLLKLAEKWGSLDFETQRYIATMAAGSRQQSRFIAMMSDYGRTTELVGQAQNSAGASQKQFEKTQDSLATSLTRLKNAWDEFLMGLANNEALKFGVDMLTKVLETINKITDSISSGNGLTKSLVSLIGVVGMLKGGRSLLGNTGVGQFLGQFTGGKTSFKETITETSNPEGNGVVRTIIKEPVKEGQQAGQQAGQGFILGFKNAIQAKKDGVDVGGQLKAMFTSGYTKDGDKARKSNASNKKTNFLAMAYDKNQNTLGSAADLESVLKAYDDVIAKGGNFKDATSAANQELEKLGLSAIELEQDFYNTGTATETMNLNMGALGSAVMGVGGALGLLASLFESLGMEETAEVVGVLAGVFMGLGTVMTTLSSIAPMLGMSFTTAGIQITTAGVTSQLAWWWVFVIIGAIALLAVGVAALIKVAKDNSLEGRMQAAAEATERAKEAAESANQAYEDLLSAKSGYDELQNKLDTLTKGTLEWKQALIDSNAQVLELLDKYRELAKYLTRGKNGELEISEAGWDYIEGQQWQSVQNTNAAVVASQIDEIQLKNEQAQQWLFKTGKEAGITITKKKHSTTGRGRTKGTYIAAHEEDILKIYQKYKEMPEFFESNQVVEEFAKSINRTRDEILAMKDAILQYDRALAESETILQAQLEALLSSQISDKTADYKYSKELVAGMAAGFTANQDEREKEIAGKLYSKDGVSESLSNEYFRQIAKENGLTVNDFIGTDKDDLEILYAKMAGIERKDIAEGLKGNIDKLTAEIAKMQAAKEAGDQVDQVYQAISKLNEDTQRDYAILISKDISNANQEFIDEFSKAKTDKDLEKMAKNFGFKDEFDVDGNVIKTAAQLMAENFGYEGDIEKMKAGFVEVAKFAKDEFTKNTEQVAKHKIDLDKDYFDKLNLAQRQSYVDLLMYADSLGTKDTIQEGLNQILSVATDEQKEKISSFMGSIGDWTQEGVGESFLEFLKTLGINIEEIIPEANKFATGIKTVNAAFRMFDTSSFMGQIQGKIDEIDKIVEQNSLSNEQYLEYFKDGLIELPEEWFWNGKKWVSKTETGMSNLITALQKNTEALLGTTREEAQAQIDFYNEKSKQIDSTETAYLNIGIIETEGTSVNIVQKVTKERIYSGKATEEEWKLYGFKSQKEYEQFIALASGGLAEAYAIIAMIDSFKMPPFTVGGSGSKYENSYDKYHNTYEEIDKLLREREKLERRYDKLLKDRLKTTKDLIENSKQELANLEAQRKEQELLVKGKKAQMAEVSNKKKFKDYFTVDLDTGEIGITDAGYRLKGKNGEKYDELYEEYVEYRDQFRDAQDALDEINDAIEEVRGRGKEDYLELENRIKEALVANRQKEIDKLSEINESINDTNSKLLDSMQQQIDEYRQNRDNEKTEKELEDKQRRLAYLQQDTSGANAMEILNLQKEIDEGQESYTDQLIDQKISELQKQNDEAAEQRQHQIELLEKQLEHDKEAGKFWKEVQEYMDGLKTGDTALLISLLQDAEDYGSMSEAQKKDFDTDLDSQIKSSASYMEVSNLQQPGTLGQEESQWSGKYPKPSTATRTLKKGVSVADDVRGLQEALQILGYYTGSIDGSFGSGTEKAVKLFQEHMGIPADGKVGPKTREAFARHPKQFKTGGLADFTGPAWLDGTKSRPEYILNADQTKAFFTLIDILSGLTSKGSQTTQNTGDSNYDIDINVESIGSDYDVEQLASKIKSLINEDARYRNNNAINLMR